MEVHEVQSPQGADSVRKPLLTKQQWQENCSQTLCQGTLGGSPSLQAPSAGEGLMPGMCLCEGKYHGKHTQEPVLSSLQLRQGGWRGGWLKRLLRCRTVVRHKCRLCLAPLCHGCGGGSSQFVSHQLVWLSYEILHLQTQKPCLETCDETWVNQVSG